MSSTGSKTKLHIDSLTLGWMCKLFGKTIERNSGVHFFSQYKRKGHSLFLTAGEFEGGHFITLPYWENLDDICLNDYLTEEISLFNEIVIGISSPKQDRLAHLIQKKFPDKKIFCLGAAIYTNATASKYDSLGLSWLFLLRKDGKRFWIKISQTFISAFRIILLKSERKDFRDFLDQL